MEPLPIRFFTMNAADNISDYDSAIQWIYDRIDYERIRPRRNSTHFQLERVERLLALVGSPQTRIPAVQIAGTKGKGSTAVMLQSILTAADHKTGLFTSPHIHRFEERIRVNGTSPTEAQLTALVQQFCRSLQSADEEFRKDGPTYFEVATVLAWMFFDECQVELAVLETGLGGRLDCTTVCQPLLTIITNIGLDHTHILGDTHAEIAAEKAGIMKPSIPLLSWVKHPEAVSVIDEFARRLNCQIYQGGREILLNQNEDCFGVQTPGRQIEGLKIPLAGDHQKKNAALSVAAAMLLKDKFAPVTDQSIRQGLASVSWPLRFEIVSQAPVIVLDAAHNPDSAAALADTVNSHNMPGHRVLVFGSSRDKDAIGILKNLLPSFQTVILSEYRLNPRATSVDELKQIADRLNADVQIHVQADLQAALQQANDIAGSTGSILGTGSIFLAAELRSLLTTKKP